jgi:hypothetical protein
MLEKEFVEYNEALALKELGFDEFCFGYYRGTKLITLLDGIVNDYDKLYNGNNVELKNDINRPYVTAPTYSQAFRWFRDKHDLFGTPNFFNKFLIFDTKSKELIVESNTKYKSYEKAELECLKKLIEIIKNK